MRFLRVVALLLAVSICGYAEAAEKIRLGMWGGYYPDAVIEIAKDKLGLLPDFEFFQSTDFAVQNAALGAQLVDLTTSQERLFTCDPAWNCRYAAHLTVGGNYVLNTAPSIVFRDVGKVKNVLYDFVLGDSRCTNVVNDPSQVGGPAAYLNSYLDDKNEELKAAGETPIELFCGTREDYANEVGSGKKDNRPYVIYDVKIGGASKRMAALLRNDIDAAMLHIPLYFTAEDAGFSRRLNWLDLPVNQIGGMPEAGLIGTAEFLATERGKQAINDLCKAYNQTVDWIRAHPDEGRTELMTRVGAKDLKDMNAAADELYGIVTLLAACDAPSDEQVASLKRYYRALELPVESNWKR